MAPAEQASLIAHLRDTLAKQYGPGRVQVLETHISYVVLTGEWVYKIKKSVRLGFLDFSTLARRRFYCAEELRLNRRYAPALYEEVVAIGGALESPVIGGTGPAIEYAVKMREFAQEDLASSLLGRGELSATDIDCLAAKIATFHHACERAATSTANEPAATVLQAARDNFTDINRLAGRRGDPAILDHLERWTEREFAALSGRFAQRIRDGFVRECHGDLHLNNIARVGGELTPFDCVEFSPELRWIDVISEVAFLVMDLQTHGRRDFAYRFLNAYLEQTGDYAGLAVLRFYVVYRAMVRAKIALLGEKPSAVSPSPQLPQAYNDYVGVAEAWARPMRPGVVLMHGLSGCGKSTVSQRLLEQIGAVRVRSDIERKRLAGLAARAGSGSRLDSGLYAGSMTQATYDRLFSLMHMIREAGQTVIVDATFLRREDRQMFRSWAQDHDVPFAIVGLKASLADLRERVRQRTKEGTDASEATVAVLEYQIKTMEPFVPGETDSLLVYDASGAVDDGRLVALADTLRDRFASPRTYPSADQTVLV
jgi:aminoglycoside phosphotransferase family enzyme/predicted kinase